MSEGAAVTMSGDPFAAIGELVMKSGGCAVIDGGMAVQLERYGADLEHPLWTAVCLIDNPAMVRQAHWDYLEAGAQVLLTASYQASLQGFAAHGPSAAEGEQLLRASVALAVDARDHFWMAHGGPGPRALVGASIGSYGAFLADGSESSGDYGPAVTLDTLKEFHRRRIVVMAEAGADLLALETIPSKLEARALVEVLEEEDVGVPAWVSFNSTDGETVVRGDSFRDCAELVGRSAKVVAVGINCTPPPVIERLIRIAREATSKPVVVYPNRGGIWDAAAKRWDSPSAGASDERLAAYAREWRRAGATLIGGCCLTTPDTVRAIARALRADSDEGTP